MKKVLAGLLLSLFAFPVLAGPYGHRHHGHHNHHFHNRHWHHNNGWVIPALIGGAVVYAATRPDPIVIQPTIPQASTVSSIVIIDGIQYQKQIVIINGIQQEVLVRIQ